MECNALYFEKNNPRSLLSLLPNDIFNLCLEHVRKNACHCWIEANNIDMEYLKVIRQIEVEEGVIFPIKPVLEMADKKWKDKIYHKNYDPHMDVWSEEYFLRRIWQECGFFCPGKEFSCYVNCPDLPPPYKINNGMWVWYFANVQPHQGGLCHHFILYDNLKEKNPKIITYDEDHDCVYYNKETGEEIYLDAKPDDINPFLELKDKKWFDELPRWEDKYHLDRSVDIFKEYPDVTIEYLCKKLI